MSAATERAKALRAELAAAEAQAKAERQAQRQAEREARLAEEHRLAGEYRAENYEGTVGEDSSYLAVSSTYTGGVEIDVVEWRTPQTSVYLSREQAKALIEVLQNLVK
jgi:hypothetical protein